MDLKAALLEALIHGDLAAVEALGKQADHQLGQELEMVMSAYEIEYPETNFKAMSIAEFIAWLKNR